MPADFNNLSEVSVDPVSTATMRSIDRVCELSDAMTCGNHVAPSWETRTAVTKNLSAITRLLISSYAI